MYILVKLFSVNNIMRVKHFNEIAVVFYKEMEEIWSGLNSQKKPLHKAEIHIE